METEKREEMSFETALARLEVIVKSLESGNVPLDQSLSLFEEGVSLVKFCNEKLDNAEQKVRLLMVRGDNSVQETDFKGE